MDDMLKNKWTSALLGMLSMVVILGIFVSIPSIQMRLRWRLDQAITYVRVVMNPISDMPTPEAVPQDQTLVAEIIPTRQSTSTPTPRPTNEPTPLPTPTPTSLPASASLPAPEYERQGMNNCGPASLSTYLRFYNWQGSQEDIAGVLKTKPEDRNINVEELDYYVKNYAGWLRVEYRVGGNINLIKSLLANGIPVMIESSMKADKTYWPNDDQWVGHYLFINGYNDATQTVVTQDTYYGPDMAVSYSKLERDWQSFNHVYIVIYLPEQEETVKQVLGENWDQDKNRENALEQAKKDAELEPDNAFHWFNIGTNLVYFERYGDAAAAYDEARNLGLPQRMLRYQFGPFLAYFNALRTDDLMSVAKYAVTITPNSEEAHLWLGWAYFRNGDRQTAESEFKKALKENYKYTDAQYALNYLSSP